MRSTYTPCAKSQRTLSHTHHNIHPATRDVSKRSELQVGDFQSRKWDIQNESETELKVSACPTRQWDLCLLGHPQWIIVPVPFEMAVWRAYKTHMLYVKHACPHVLTC